MAVGRLVGAVEVGGGVNWAHVCVCEGVALKKRPIMASTLPQRSIHLDALF